MLEITIDNVQKCDLEAISDPDNNQYFWIREEIQKLKPNVTGKLFLISIKTIDTKIQERINTKYYISTNSFEKIVKSCKETNLEFLKLKKKQVYAFMNTFVMNKSLFQRQKKILHSKMLKIRN